jgi:hypothetical protein
MSRDQGNAAFPNVFFLLAYAYDCFHGLFVIPPWAGIPSAGWYSVKEKRGFFPGQDRLVFSP